MARKKQVKTPVSGPDFIIRQVCVSDVAQLDRLEKSAFATDRLSHRRLQHWVRADHRVFLVAERDQRILGYGLVLLRRGTRLARLYSLAVDKAARGGGVGKSLLAALEDEAQNLNRLYMRLEVAVDNKPAISLYESFGYRVVSWLPDYYEDHGSGLRMQKRIRVISQNELRKPTPWYPQTTEFTCGSAALLMAMGSLDPSRMATQDEELDIWREATTIFMTSGHGGSHPVGLGLAAHKRGYEAEVHVNQEDALFVDGVRSEEKKHIMTLVDRQFRHHARQQGVRVCKHEVSQADIARYIASDRAVVILISTYRMDGRKAPHWVTVSGMDDQCLYVHDPDSGEKYTALDCKYLPIARSDFERMSSFGASRLRACVVLGLRDRGGNRGREDGADIPAR